MFKITHIEVKYTSTGKEYKALTGDYNDNPIKVSMWSNHPEYENAVEGYEFDCVITNDGKYNNFEVEGQPTYSSKPKSQPVADQQTSAKLEAIWTGIKEIGRHLDIEYFKAGLGGRHTEEEIEMLASLKPSDIPF